MMYLTQNTYIFGKFDEVYIFNSMISNGTIWFILAGVIIIVIAIVFAIKKRKNKKNGN